MDVVCLLELHMESFFVSVVYCQQRRAPGADVTNRSILDAVALGEVPVIIVGDVQGNPAEQSDQMSGALRRGWLVDEGWEHRPQPPGCPAPTFISGGSETRIEFVLTNRLAPGMFRKFRVGGDTWVPKHRAIFFELETRPFSSCNEESVPVLRWMLCGLNTSVGIPVGLEIFRTALGTSDVTLAWRTLSSTIAEAMAKQCEACDDERQSATFYWSGSIAWLQTMCWRNRFVRTSICTLRESRQGFSEPTRAPHPPDGSAMGTSPHLRQTGRHCAYNLLLGYGITLDQSWSVGTFVPGFWPKICHPLDLKSFPSQTILRSLEEHCQRALESQLQE